MRNWEQCYQTGETPWDKGAPAPPLLELIDRHGAALWGNGPVLVPGCGLGHDVRALAALGLPVCGLDIAETATANARAVPAVGAETYETGDFLDPAWREGRQYSAIWEHTCFCAIDPSRGEIYAESAAAVLAPGGVLAGVFFLTPRDPGAEETGPPFETSIAELHGLFLPAFECTDAWVPRDAYPGREGREWIGVFRKLPQDQVAGKTSCR